jgi:hypothetical protein
MVARVGLSAAGIRRILAYTRLCAASLFRLLVGTPPMVPGILLIFAGERGSLIAERRSPIDLLHSSATDRVSFVDAQRSHGVDLRSSID